MATIRRHPLCILLSLLCACALVLLAIPGSASAVTSEEKRAEAQAAREKLDAWQAQLNQASDDYYAAMEERDEALARMAEAQERIDAAQERISELQDHLGDRVNSMYRTGEISYLEVLMETNSFDEFVNTWDILNDLNENDKALVDETKAVKQEAEDAYAEYERQEQIAQDKLDEAEAIKAQAEATVAQYQAEVARLDAEVQELVEQERQAAAAAAAARAAAENAGSYASSSPIPATGSVVDYARSRLGCPYVWGATGPDTFDCSGLTQWCYAQAGKSIPRTSAAQRSGAPAVLSVSAAEPGDILWHSGHVGICIESGGGIYIAAPQTGDVVKIQTYPQWTCALRY